MDNQIFRVWDTARNVKRNIAVIGDPNKMKMPPDCILEYQDEHGKWQVYRQPTPNELSKAVIGSMLDDVELTIEEIRRELETL